jgi:hypothetical protein
MSVATLLLAGCKQAAQEPESADSAERVKCMGINECKGLAQCGTETHTCAGQNECKGKGWVSVPRSECDAKGGKVI